LTTLVHGVETPVWEPWELVYSAVCAVGGMIGATAMFRKLQPLFAEFI
jgi:hypothetical protein